MMMSKDNKQLSVSEVMSLDRACALVGKNWLSGQRLSLAASAYQQRTFKSLSVCRDDAGAVCRHVYSSTCVGLSHDAGSSMWEDTGAGEESRALKQQIKDLVENSRKRSGSDRHEKCTAGLVAMREVVDPWDPLRLVTRKESNCVVAEFSGETAIPASHKIPVVLGEMSGEVFCVDEDVLPSDRSAIMLMKSANPETLSAVSAAWSDSAMVTNDSDEKSCPVYSTSSDASMTDATQNALPVSLGSSSVRVEAENLSAVKQSSSVSAANDGKRVPSASTVERSLLVIDWSQWSGVSSFVNHMAIPTLVGCPPARVNVKWHVVYVDGWPHVFLTSIPGVQIDPEDRLYADYGKGWFDMMREKHFKQLASELAESRGAQGDSLSGGSEEFKTQVDAFGGRCGICCQFQTGEERDQNSRDYRRMVTCDGCMDQFHLDCLQQDASFAPPAQQEWFCWKCVGLAKRVFGGERSAKSTDGNAKPSGAARLVASGAARAEDTAPPQSTLEGAGVVNGTPLLDDDPPLRRLRPCSACAASHTHGNVGVFCRLFKGHLSPDSDRESCMTDGGGEQTAALAMATRTISSLSEAVVMSEQRNFELHRRVVSLEILSAASAYFCDGSAAFGGSCSQFSSVSPVVPPSDSMEPSPEVVSATIPPAQSVSDSLTVVGAAAEPSAQASSHNAAAGSRPCGSDMAAIADEIPLLVVRAQETLVTQEFATRQGLMTVRLRGRVEGRSPSSTANFVVRCEDGNCYEISAKRLAMNIVSDLFAGRISYRTVLPPMFTADLDVARLSSFRLPPLPDGAFSPAARPKRSERRAELPGDSKDQDASTQAQAAEEADVAAAETENDDEADITPAACKPHRGNKWPPADVSEAAVSGRRRGPVAEELLAASANESQSSFDEDLSDRERPAGTRRARRGVTLRHAVPPRETRLAEECTRGSVGDDSLSVAGESVCGGTRAENDREAQALRPWMRGVTWSEKRQAWTVRYWRCDGTVSSTSVRPSSCGGVAAAYSQAVAQRVHSYQQMVQREAESLPTVSGIRWVAGQTKWNVQYRDKKTSFGALRSGARHTWHRAWTWLNNQRRECGEAPLCLEEVVLCQEGAVNDGSIGESTSALIKYAGKVQKERAHPLSLEGGSHPTIDQREILALAASMTGKTNTATDEDYAPEPSTARQRPYSAHSGIADCEPRHARPLSTPGSTRSSLPESYVLAAAEEAQALLPFPSGIIWARTTARFFALYKDEFTKKKRFKTFDPRKFHGSVKEALAEAALFLRSVDPWVGSRRDSAQFRAAINQFSPEETPPLVRANNDIEGLRPLSGGKLVPTHAAVQHYSTDPDEALKQMEAEVLHLPSSDHVKWYRSKRGFSATYCGRTKWFSAYSRSVRVAYLLANQWVAEQQHGRGAEVTARAIIESISRMPPLATLAAQQDEEVDAEHEGDDHHHEGEEYDEDAGDDEDCKGSASPTNPLLVRSAAPSRGRESPSIMNRSAVSRPQSSHSLVLRATSSGATSLNGDPWEEDDNDPEADEVLQRRLFGKRRRSLTASQFAGGRRAFDSGLGGSAGSAEPVAKRPDGTQPNRRCPLFAAVGSGIVLDGDKHRAEQGDDDDFLAASDDSENNYDVQARRLPRIPNVCWVPQKQAFSVFYYKGGTKTTKAFNPLHYGGVKRSYKAAAKFCKQMKDFLTKPLNGGLAAANCAAEAASNAMRIIASNFSVSVVGEHASDCTQTPSKEASGKEAHPAALKVEEYSKGAVVTTPAVSEIRIEALPTTAASFEEVKGEARSEDVQMLQASDF